MADEQIEELPAEGAAVAGGGGNPWIPVIVILIMLPVLSFAMTEFVLIPKIKTAVGADKTAPGNHTGEGHGKGHGDGDAKAGKVMTQYAFDDIVANLSGSMQSRYVKVSFTVEGDDPNFEALMDANKVKMVDITLGVLNSLSMRDLEQPGIKNIVRNDLLSAFHTLMKKKVIHQIYFTAFVVQ